MYIESDDRLSQPADRVYPLVRDEMPLILPYLPDVEEIIRVSYARESDTRVRIVNTWRAKNKIPAKVQRFLPPNLLTWTDRALWKDDEYCVDYELEGYGYSVKGTNWFRPDEGGTVLKVTGEVTIYPEKFKVPRIVFKRVFPMIENTIKAALQPNLTSLARGLKAYFAEKG